MTNPMYCPMSFNNPGAGGWGQLTPRQCTPDCAWAISNGESYACAIVADATVYGYKANSRPLKEEE